MATGKALIAMGLLLFLSLGCASPWPGTSSKANFLSTWGWGSLIPVALSVVIFLLALGYIAATFTNDEKLKVWVRKEVGQAFYSVIILIFAVALIGVLDQGLRALSVDAGSLVTSASWGQYVEQNACCDGSMGTCLGPVRKRPCHIELASQYLQFLYETAKMNALSSLMNYWFSALLANMSLGISLLVFTVQAGLSVTPFAGLNAAADYFSLLFDLAVKTMMMSRAQQVLLDYLNYPLFAIFMAMGLVLRIFYFTRKLGGLLVALALSFYTIYPMFYVVSYAVLWGMLGSATPYGGTPFGATYDPAAYPAVPFSESQPTDFLPSGQAKDAFDESNRINIDVCSTFDHYPTNDAARIDREDSALIRENFRSRWDQIMGSKWYGQFSDMLTVWGGGGFDKDGPIGALATVMVFSLVVPFLAIMTTLATVKVISPMMGGDVEISVLSRLI